jgi:UDP-galactopyranose mutase
MRSDLPLVVFSHLRWDFVFQRPQHLLTRLAASRPVVYVEEPVRGPGEPFWQFTWPAPGLTVARPHTPVDAAGYGDEQLPHLRDLVARLIAAQGWSEYVCWFYTPMALPLAELLAPKAVVYDCMDELSAFKFAPPQLLGREAELLRRADVVFTGGPSLYAAKRDRHPNVHCFPSSVDAAHFAKATDPAMEAAEQRDLPRPRLGYFGVIDERIDLDLIAAAADARPDWQFVMVGPVAKIDPELLPRNPNIHYIGQQPYGRLPEFLAGWDVALMPFARNESTKFISPTKVLEYMAAEKPIVSTPITDVAEPYGQIVHLADTPEEFVAACKAALGWDAAERARRVDLKRQVLARTSWDATAAAMAVEIDRAVERRSLPTPVRGPGKNAERESGVLDDVAPAAPPLTPHTGTQPVVVIGAGPTGLSAAYHVGEDALLIEANATVGGWCRSLVDNGFTFDWAGHIMFSNDPYVHEMYEMLLGDNVHWQDREAWIYSKDVYTRYPFQGSLYGLPADVITECIMGAIEARFGPLAGKDAESPAPSSNGHAVNGNGHAKTNGHVAGCAIRGDAKGDSVSDCCGDGVLESTARLVKAGLNGNDHANGDAQSKPQNFEEFIYKVWGAGIAKHFAIPYNRKLWAVPLTEMETSWLGGRVPMPDLKEMIEGALSPKPKPMGPNARFGYPLRGGFQSLMDGFLRRLRGELRLNTRVVDVSPSRHTVTLSDGSEVRYEALVSTMPLPVLIRSMGNEVPAAVRKAAAALKYLSVRCVNIGVGRENLTEKHWIYYPEDTVFHRIFLQGNASPHCNRPGGFGLTCEITYSPTYKPLPCDGEALIRRCIDDCVKVGMFNADDPIWAANQVDMPHAYVVYDHARPQNVAVIREWLEAHDILLAGRYSEWEYYNSDHAFLAGKKAAERAREKCRRPVTV